MSLKGAQIKYDLSGGRNRTGRTEAEVRSGALGISQQQSSHGADVSWPRDGLSWRKLKMECDERKWDGNLKHLVDLRLISVKCFFKRICQSREKPMRPHPYIKNYRQLRNARSSRCGYAREEYFDCMTSILTWKHTNS